MELNRRARIVKRAPLWKRILNAPEDYLMKVENDIRALDWDVLQEGFSWPLAFGLNMLLVSVKLGYWLDDPLANVPSVLRYDRSYSSSKSLLPGFAALDKQLIFGEVHREYNNQFVHPKLFVRKYDKQISTGTDTGVDSIGVDSTYYATSTGRRPRAFRHLSVPASSSTFELNTQSSKSPSSTGYESEEEGEEEMEEEDEVSSDDSDDGDEDSSEHDPDVEYDEEGEETAVPHPTNSLAFDDDDDDDE
ncbi:hypothetical protein BGX28_008420 [Mortierella sp. GBA30]|nr:hypothetical protein BGX28_008420 [Mortierella sp. GBA30]